MSKFSRWVTLALIVVLSLGAVLLGRWQLQRLDARQTLNAALQASLALPPVDLTSARAEDEELDGRRVVARGRFDQQGEVFLRGRSHMSQPGLHVVTPFVVDSTGHIIWVLRGFVASPDASTPPALVPPPTPNRVAIRGIAQPLPVTDDGGQPLGTGARTSYRRLDRGALAGRIPGALPIYLLLEGDAGGPGQLPPADPPALDDGPHLSYAIQWFAIALAIAAFGIIVVRRGGRASPRPRATP